MYTYVKRVGKEVTDLISFYYLPSTVLHSKNKKE